jgi:DNA-binding MarR family transcriptional regulator
MVQTFSTMLTTALRGTGTMPTTGVAETLVDVLSRAERRVNSRIAGVLASQGSTLDEWRVLSLLVQRGGQSMSAIAAATLMAPPTLTKRIDVMVADGMVYRRVDDTDRRRVLVLLAPRGKTAHRRLAERVAEEHRRIAVLAAGSGLDVEEITTALAGLVKALDEGAGTTDDPVAASAAVVEPFIESRKLDRR